MKKFDTKRLCRGGMIAALYVALTYAFMPLAFGPIQVRPAEALCILPLFFPEAIPALCMGCTLSNLASPFLLYDVIFGSLVTLTAAFCTYLVGRFFKKERLKPWIGGAFPILFNALFIPYIIVFLCGGTDGYDSTTAAYFAYVLSMFITEALWIYALGIPLYSALEKHRKKGVSFLS